MKKILAFLTVISALIGLMALSAFAAAPTKDGVYEVPIQLKHAEKILSLWATAILFIPLF